MNILEVVLLGIVQGITESFPISSSGHIVIIQKFSQLSVPTLMFNVSLHVGSLVAVVTVLHKDVSLMARTLFNFSGIVGKYGSLKESYAKNKGVRLLVLLIFGSIPTSIIGLIFRNFYNFFLSSTICVGLMLILSGLFLWSTRNFGQSKKTSILQIEIKDLVIIGLMQGLAVIPGMSRSGVTISTGLMLGMSHKLIGRFSFLLSIPAILGAFVLSLFSSKNLGIIFIELKFIAIGIAVSAITGCLMLKITLYIIKSKSIHMFAPYCFLIGLLILMSD